MREKVQMETKLDGNRSPKPSQIKKLGLWMCTALVVGNMIGSGIFLLPASLAPYGAISIVGWVVTSFGAIVLALIFGRLARIVSKAGGPYAYTREGFGEFPGFLIAWGYWIALWSGNAAVAVAFAGYLGFFLPGSLQSSYTGLILAVAAIWSLTWVNIRGVQAAGTIQVITTVMKILPLLLIGLYGLAWIEADHFTPFNQSGQGTMSAVAACAALTLWAFIGLESATVPSGDVERPEVTIPRATVMGTSFAAVLYILVTVSVLGLLPPAALAGSSAPLADAAKVMLGTVGGVLVAVGACVSTFGTLNGFTLLSGQVPLSAARDGLFPKRFGRLSGSGTPAFALIVSNTLATIVVAMNFTKGLVEAFTFIILLATLTTLVPYLFCALAELMIYVRKGRTLAPGQFSRIVTLGLLGFLYTSWTIFGAGQEVVFYGFLLLLAGVPVHVAIKWSSSGRRAFKR